MGDVMASVMDRLVVMSSVVALLSTAVVATAGAVPHVESYGDGGYVLDHNGPTTTPDAIVTRPDGSTLTLATGSASGAFRMAVLAHDRAGRRISSFGDGGSVLVSHPNTRRNVHAYARDLLVQPDGRMLILGSSGYYLTGDDGVSRHHSESALVRLTAAGRVDTSFGVGGFSPDVIDGFGLIAGAIDAGGGIVALGEATGYYLMLLRFHPDGSLDRSFGDGDGTILLVPHEGWPERSVVRSGDLAIDRQGRILIAATMRDGRGRDPVTVWRFDAEGNADTSFGTGGIAAHLLGDSSIQTAGRPGSGVGALLVDDADRAVMTGYVSHRNATRSFLARVLPSGQLDSSFGSGGMVAGAFSGRPGDRWGYRARALAQQADGKLVIGGGTGDDDRFALARYHADGRPDTAFGRDGVLTWPIAAIDGSSVRALAVHDNGELAVAAACGYDVFRFHLLLTRFRPSGAATAPPLSSCRFESAPEKPSIPSCSEGGAARFPDVPRDHPHAPGIGCAAQLELIQGTASGGFAPNATLTRGQIASILHRSLERSGIRVPSSSSAGFRDIAGSPHATAIGDLAAAGIILGRDSRTFDPQGSVTRGQLMSLLDRTSSEYLAAYPPVSGPRFRDIVGSPHAAPIDRLNAAGIANGLSGGRDFGPGDPVTRAQAASFVTRWLQDQRGRSSS
jgi:uncharacterized delta-60 repeat protein